MSVSNIGLTNDDQYKQGSCLRGGWFCPIPIKL